MEAVRLSVDHKPNLTVRRPYIQCRSIMHFLPAVVYGEKTPHITPVLPLSQDP
jgi:hypothetical protein